MWEYKARFVQAVDGDTVDLEIDLGFKTYKIVRVRLKGVDTPERGQLGFDEATHFVEKWFAYREYKCIVRTVKTGKYGRWLALIFPPSAGEPTLNEKLLESGHAVLYGTQK